MPSTMTTMLMAAAMGALAMVSPAAAAAAAAVPSAPFVRVPFNDCSATGKSHVSGVEVSASSWPPRAGSETVLRVAGQLDGEVASGTYKLSARYLGQQTITTKGDLGTFVDLPAAAGAINIAGTLALPADSPAGPYFVQLEFDADNGETLTCVDVKFILDKVRPTVQIADDAAAADPSVLQPIVDASAEQERAELMAEKHRVELANRMADRMNGDIEVPVITIDASLPTDKEPGTITVSAPVKPQ